MEMSGKVFNIERAEISVFAAQQKKIITEAENLLARGSRDGIYHNFYGSTIVVCPRDSLFSRGIGNGYVRLNHFQEHNPRKKVLDELGIAENGYELDISLQSDNRTDYFSNLAGTFYYFGGDGNLGKVSLLDSDFVRDERRPHFRSGESKILWVATDFTKLDYQIAKKGLNYVARKVRLERWKQYPFPPFKTLLRIIENRHFSTGLPY